MSGMTDLSWGSAATLDSIRGEVAIVGVGETAHTGPSGRKALDMAAEAIRRALDDCGLRPEDVDGLMVAGMVEDQFTAAIFRDYFGRGPELWFSPDGGAASQVGSAPYAAAHALRRGEANVIVNVFGIDWATKMRAQTASPGDVHLLDPMKADFEAPFGYYPQPVYFATMAQRHAYEFGTTDAQRGAFAATQRRHANTHPGAVMRDRPLSVESFLASPCLIDPLRKEDCCLISDGAGAFVMTSAARARDLARRPVIIEGVGRGFTRSGSHITQQRAFLETPHVFAAPGAFRMAGLTPADVDVLAAYDCSSITAMMQIEDMGFCPKGEIGAFAEEGRLAFDRPRRQGGMPFNTHGGMMSHSYVLGIAHVIELVRQLRGEAANQVECAEIAVYGGYSMMECSALVLRVGERPGA